MAKSDRRSWEITGSQADKIWDAAFHADELGMPLNAFLTIHWDNQGRGSGEHGIEAVTVQERNSRLLICARRWLGRRDVDLACVWVIERGFVAGGLHAHNLIYVPRHLLAGFTGMLPRWTGNPAVPKDQWPDMKRKEHVLGYGQDGIWQLMRVYDHGVGLRRYLLKGASDRWNRLGIRHSDQGIVVGKRCGSSNNLGPTARGRYRPPAVAA